MQSFGPLKSIHCLRSCQKSTNFAGNNNVSSLVYIVHTAVTESWTYPSLHVHLRTWLAQRSTGENNTVFGRGLAADFPRVTRCTDCFFLLRIICFSESGLKREGKKLSLDLDKYYGPDNEVNQLHDVV